MSVEGTISTTASQNSISSKFSKKNSMDSDREVLKSEILKMEIPVKLSCHLLSYFDDCLSYAYTFVSEKCDGNWHRYCATCRWSLKETIMAFKYFETGVENVTKNPVSKPLTVVPEISSNRLRHFYYFAQTCYVKMTKMSLISAVLTIQGVQLRSST